ncbi:hypothetical protein [Amycolatopsis sp. WGS_07]|uniref:hypothetical protein n=1 Tax=Amycolatopsis sp. WGS_07 TaxID=3076764 RepID=UPI003872BA09
MTGRWSRLPDQRGSAVGLTGPELVSWLRDLQATLALDFAFLSRALDERSARPDAVRDLGERLLDLGRALVRRADHLNEAVLASLPAHGWLPQAGAPENAPRLAHQVGRRPLRCGPVYLGLCGAACFPMYGRDPHDHTKRYERCARCQSKAGTLMGRERPGKPDGEGESEN